MNNNSVDKQVALLMQGTAYGDDETYKSMASELRARLVEFQHTGRPLKVYCGYDPRTSDLHLGHTITMRKLRQFQELGHEVTFLIGSYTSLIGDPSDKDKLRPQLTEEEVERNARTYAEQAFKILDREKTRIRHNGEWLAGLKLKDLIYMASPFTVQQFLTRENFAQRMEKGDPIYLHETFYALMQGYDAVAQETDVQVGGTDQLFNIMTAGRKMQAAYGQKPQVGIIMAILPGTDGVIKMSKSLGNHIPILSSPEDMYGKVMSIPDSAIEIYFQLVTRYAPAQIEAIVHGLRSEKLHPRDAKMELAREIVSIFHGADAAVGAEEHFKRVFQEHELPTDIEIREINEPTPIVDYMYTAGTASSMSEARRLIDQGAVRLNGETIKNGNFIVVPGKNSVLQVGKRKFRRIP
ncbi:MAG: tyrosine--tRNA ligase [Chloroflexi bacterium]|nr:tyrosine--tRNA ligase [Chloroflexota bacterium]